MKVAIQPRRCHL